MSVFHGVIGLISPPDCLGCGAEGVSLCEACRVAEIIPYGERCFICGTLSNFSRTCQKCRPSSPSHVVVATDYQGLAQELVQAFKFKHRRSVAEEIANLMTETFMPYLRQINFRSGDYLVVPVPTASARIRERGFDHSALLAKNICRGLNLGCQPALRRLGQSQQVGARRAERLKQLAGSFYALDPASIAGKNILLIDDVVTTGATLREATKVLRRAGAKSVDALVFAKRV